MSQPAVFAQTDRAEEASEEIVGVDAAWPRSTPGMALVELALVDLDLDDGQLRGRIPAS